jgi:hypothetical protein
MQVSDVKKLNHATEIENPHAFGTVAANAEFIDGALSAKIRIIQCVLKHQSRTKPANVFRRPI